MKNNYESNIKIFRIAGVVVGLGLLAFGAARLFMSGDIFSLGEFGLLGLSSIVTIFCLTSKMEHDLEKEGEADEEMAEAKGKEKEEDFEHDIGY